MPICRRPAGPPSLRISAAVVTMGILNFIQRPSFRATGPPFEMMTDIARDVVLIGHRIDERVGISLSRTRLSERR